MKKAIIELEDIPESCSYCPVSHFSRGWYVCEYLDELCPNQGRLEKCPIKEVEIDGE
ncbi:MAG: hypothetical protein MJZ81_10860 [Bacteroidales bacterium]|nr:hypothetical protein [Bacteroidales bacterium]